MHPQPVTNLDLAFPGDVAHLMPSYEEIPTEFKKDRNPWCEFTNNWFFSGAKMEALVEKDGIDKIMALRHAAVIMSSFQPKHEHKIAAVSYLLSQWFDFAQTPTEA